jgi:hypothetical protein
MSTSAGSKRLDAIGSVPGFGNAYFDPSGIANIHGFSHLAKLGCITFDSDVDDIFTFQPRGKEGKVVEFKKTPEGLYAYTPNPKFMQVVAAKKWHTPLNKEMQVPQQAGKHDGNAHGGNRLWMETIMKCPVTVDDVDSAEKISGPGMGTTQGKYNRHAPELVMEHPIETPTELKAQHKECMGKLKECHDTPSPVAMSTENKECPGKLKECSDAPIPDPFANGNLPNEYESIIVISVHQ